MIIQTSRFGKIEIASDDILTFNEGLLGFSDLRKFVILDDPNDEIFAWLQSCEDANIAFPILEPELFMDAYKAVLTKTDLEMLDFTQPGSAGLRYFSIVTIPEDPTLMTANLKAPVIVNIEKRTARQCVLQDNSLAIKEPIFSKLQQRVVQSPQRSIKEQSQSKGLTIKLKPAITDKEV